MQPGGGRVKTWKRLLFWLGVHSLNLRLKWGVSFIDFVFGICPNLRAA